MGNNIQRAIVKTLLYSDIFDYPLTKDEIWEYLIAKKSINREVFEKILKSSQISKKNSFYFLKERNSIVKTRIKRGRESFKKIIIAKKIASILSRIPTIQLIGLSGALAMNNSDENDDIDFFIITSKGSLWTTRLLSLIFLQILGYRRRRNEKNVSNKICLNMLISIEQLELPIKLHDLYTAHEIVQIRVLFQRNNTYEKFMTANKWVAGYLPNSINIEKRGKSSDIKESRYLNTFEHFTQKIQLLSINNHKTTETVTDTILAFHPKDYRNFVLKEYNRRLKHKSA